MISLTNIYIELRIQYDKYFKLNNKFITPEKAYDLLSNNYDNSYNILNALDRELLKKFKPYLHNEIKNTLDFGAGTGRNISFLKTFTLKKIYGIDISIGMLNKLKDKHPSITIEKYQKNKKLNIENKSIDLIVSNLVIGYIDYLDSIFTEWKRIISDNGLIIITDLHPSINNRKLNRNFNFNGTNLIIKSINHSKKKLEFEFSKMNWEIIKFEEMVIDKEVKYYFKSESDYNNLFGKKLIYGYVLKNKKC